MIPNFIIEPSLKQVTVLGALVFAKEKAQCSQFAQQKDKTDLLKKRFRLLTLKYLVKSN